MEVIVAATINLGQSRARPVTNMSQKSRESLVQDLVQRHYGYSDTQPDLSTVVELARNVESHSTTFL